MQQPAAMIGDWGYQAYVSAGNATHEFGQGQYKSPVGLFTAGVDQRCGRHNSAPGIPGRALVGRRGPVPVQHHLTTASPLWTPAPWRMSTSLQENRDVGSTNSSGRLLVPDMRAFDLNHIAIVATDIPPDVTIDDATREVRPQDRSGVVVRFPMKIQPCRFAAAGR